MVAKNESAVEITNEEFNEIINSSHKLVVVDFFADWCMPCLMLAPVIEELADKMKDVKFVKINVDENRALSGRYRISNIPCLVVFKEGREVDRIIGGQSADVIEDKIKEYLE